MQISQMETLSLDEKNNPQYCANDIYNALVDNTTVSKTCPINGLAQQ